MPTTNTPSSADSKPPSARATVALSLGIASIPLGPLLGFAAAILLGLPAIILGSITLRRTRQDLTAGRKHALTGIVTGVVGIAAPLVLSLMIGPHL